MQHFATSTSEAARPLMSVAFTARAWLLKLPCDATLALLLVAQKRGHALSY